MYPKLFSVLALGITVALAGSLFAAPASVSGGGVTLRSVDVSMPFVATPFPDGPGADVVDSNCLACHTAGMVMTQPNLTQAVWKAEVEKMRAAYKAPIDDKDVPTIVGYLVRLKGTP